MTIKLLSPNNTFEQWTYTTRSLIGIYNSLTDGNINTYIVSANTRSIETYDWANTVNVKIQSYSNFTNTVNTFIWNTKANTDAAFLKANTAWDFANTVNTRIQSTYDLANSVITNSNTTDIFVNASFTFANTLFDQLVTPTYVGSGASNTGTVNLPSTIQANDIIILAQSSDGTSPSIPSVLTNWTLIKSNFQSGVGLTVQYKLANTVPETQITGLTVNMPAIAVVFRSVDNVSFASETTNSSGNVRVSVTSTDITSNTVSLLVGALDRDAVANSTTAPSGYTLANVSDSLVTYESTVMAAYKQFPVSTATYFFDSAGNDGNYGVNIILKPKYAAIVTNQTFNNANSLVVFTSSSHNYANSVNTLIDSASTHINASFNFANTVNTRSQATYDLANTVNVRTQATYDFANTVNIRSVSANTISFSDATNINLNNPGTFGNVEGQTLTLILTSNGRISNIQSQTTNPGPTVNVQSTTIELDDYLVFSSSTQYTNFGILKEPEIFGNTSISNGVSTLNWPSAKSNGDVVFVVSVTDDSISFINGGVDGTPASPSGFTVVNRGTFGGNGYYTLSYRIINGSESSTISGLTSVGGSSHIAVGVRNCNTTSLIESSSTNLSNATSYAIGTHTYPDVPDITTTREISGLLAFGFIENSNAVFNLAPTGFNLLGYSGDPGISASAVGVAFKLSKEIAGLQTISSFNVTTSDATSTGGAYVLGLRGLTQSPATIRQNVVTVNATSRITFNANNQTASTINLSIKNALTENVTTQNTVTSNVIQINPSIYGKYQNILITSNTTFTDNLANGQTSVLAIRKPYGNTLTWPSNIQWIQNDSNNPPNGYGTKQSDKYGFDLIELRKANSSIIFANRIGTFANNSARLVGVTNSTTNTITLPSGLQANDVVVIASQSDQVTQTTPTGYTSGQLGNNASDLFYQWSYKVMGTTPDTTASGIADGTLSIAFALRGVAEAIFDNTPPAVSTGSTGMPNPPLATLTTSDPILNIIIGFLDDDNITMTAPTNYTLIRTNNYTSGSNTGTIGAAYRLITQSGSEDPGVFGGGGTDVWVAATIPFISIGY